MNAEGKDFYFPGDIVKFLNTYKEKPVELYKAQMLLEAFGVRFSKTPGESFPRATYRDVHYYIRATPVRFITVLEQKFEIPADLESALRGPQSLQVGDILSALQSANMTVEVMKDTGVVRGVNASNVMFRFPVVLDLRFKMDGKVYIIPYDLGKLVAELEKRNMPSRVLFMLYTRYGVVPVRNSENVVTALSFNGEEFPIKAQPKTVVVLGGNKYFLPADADKMATAVANKKVTAIRFMQVLQVAGYTFIPDPDGVLRSIQKGADRIDTHLDIRLFAKIDGVKYRMPSDLPRLLDVVRGLTPKDVQMIMSQLSQYGVIVSRMGDRLVIMFNGIKYEVRLKSAQSSGGNVELEIFVGNKPFKIPRDLDRVVAQAKKSGRAAVDLVMDLLQSHGIKVNRSPEGDITSIKMKDKTYKVGGGSGSSGSDGGGAGTGAAKGNAGGSSGSSGSGSGNRGEGTGRSGSVGGTGSGGNRGSGGARSADYDERCNIDVRIRGKFFRLPPEMSDLPKKLKNFKHAELFIELMHKGATLLADAESNFYAYRIHGCHVVFPQKFRILVKVDRTGRTFRVPSELGTLAKTLSSGDWNWESVRNALRSAGLHVDGYKGPIKSFSYQGKNFRVR
ncbi:hypothetical protein V5799_020664 [Amblyomma americanum]|uniref:Uncharacterized protein n=1 Tax=Amblyomma americanum TaxID=6943 RepID=A0AAQ4ET73_AMBAM